MKRYSRKRQAILDLLKNTKEHPGADSIYRQLKPVYPDLSMGTVYRNLKEMKEEGLIASVAVVKDRERFDGCTDQHTHVICSECGKIIDLEGFTLPADMLSHAEEESKITISCTKIQFVGVCDACRQAHRDTKSSDQ